MTAYGTGSDPLPATQLPPRILVVDDDEVVRELLSALLTVEGYAVTAACSGPEALLFLRAPDPPSLVLTDLQMPGLEGEALTAALRAAAPRGAIVLGMSGRTPGSAVLQPLDGFLPKPFTTQSLQNAIAAAQATRAGQHSAPATGLEWGRDDEAGPAGTSVAAPPELGAEADSAANDAPPLDEAIFLALGRSFGPSQLMEFYQLTLDDVRQRHNRMTEYAAAGDLPAVQREAHAVKGGCGMVGARELQQLATAIEKGTSLNIAALEKIPGACNRLRRMLDAKLHDSGN